MRRYKPGLTALIPDGWLVRETLELASPEEKAYIIASGYVAPPETTPEQYAKAQGDLLRDRLRDFEELSLEETTLPNGHSAFVRSFRWTSPDDERIAELQLYTVENGRGVVATARGLAAGFDELEPRLREILAGIGVGGASAGRGVLRRDQSARGRTYAAFEAGQLTTTMAEAFGLAASSGNEETPLDAVATAWKDVRDSWQRTREAL
jgi:hypothetical protein